MAKILMVDDDKDLLFMIGCYLENDDHEVDQAKNGAEAWKLIQSNTYDVMIFDWDLPDTTGLELCTKFRDDGGTTPIIMLTGRLELGDKEKGLDSGADDYVTKPFEYKELAARLRAILRRSQPKGPKALGTNNEQMLEQAGLTGTSLPSRYEFLEVIGEGAVGVVYKARHPHLNKLAAIKMLHYYGLKDDVFARFEQEARLVSSLKHPGIATVHDFGITERKRPFMVMDFVEGTGLDAIISQEDYVPLRRALTFLAQICDAMAHAHDQGIVHRDLKPGNIMLCGWPNRIDAKVLDFGCGKITELNSEQAQMTQDNMSVGTPAYMSPEQAKGIKVDKRSDIYSLGCVMYEAITGYLPLAGENSLDTMRKHLHELAPSLAEMRPDLVYPAAMETIVARAMAKDPTQRYQSMLELKAALEQVLMAEAGTA
jgi:CheY-like chemotaxis protein